MAFRFLIYPRKSIYGGKYTKDHYSSFVFPATRSPSFVIPATMSTSPQQHQGDGIGIKGSGQVDGNSNERAIATNIREAGKEEGNGKGGKSNGNGKKDGDGKRQQQ